MHPGRSFTFVRNPEDRRLRPTEELFSFLFAVATSVAPSKPRLTHCPTTLYLPNRRKGRENTEESCFRVQATSARSQQQGCHRMVGFQRTFVFFHMVLISQQWTCVIYIVWRDIKLLPLEGLSPLGKGVTRTGSSQLDMVELCNLSSWRAMVYRDPSQKHQ